MGTPTERLYYSDAYLAEFSARVVESADEGRRIYLDATAFYPTSGGQQHDVGTIEEIPVVDVIDEDSRIAHVLANPLTADRVSGAIDWHRRFDHMQQHTGQHLLSSVFEDLYGMKTVSVHFGSEYSTLDLDAESLSSEQLRNAQRRSNEVIAENRAVTVSFEDAQTAIGLRKVVDRTGTLRIVSIEGLDRSACGGTHVRATGEIGCALLRSTERIRKTVRVQFVCGLRAVERASRDFAAISGIASTLSVPVDDVEGIVANQAAQLKDAEQMRRKLEKEVAGHRAASLFANVGSASGRRVVARQSAAPSMDQLRVLGQAVTELSGCALVATTAEGNGLLVASHEHSAVDAGKVLRDALTTVGGKGGGSPRLAQGTAPSAAALSQAFDAIVARLTPDR